MASEDGELRRLQLSPSVQSAVARAANDAKKDGQEQIEAIDLIRPLLGLHGEYGGGLARSLVASGELKSTGGRRTTAEVWVREVQEWLRSQRLIADRIHGRLMIIALAALDDGLQSKLRSTGFLRAVQAEITDLDFRQFESEALTRREHESDSAVEMLNDDPTDHDLLQRRPFAEFLAAQLGGMRSNLAGKREIGSFLLHIDGPWGSGKTTILQFLDEALKSQPAHDPSMKWIVARFNAWRNQQLNPPWWALIEAIVDAVVSQTGKRRLRWAERWWRFWVPAKPHVLVAIIVGLLIFAIVFTVRQTDFFGVGAASTDPYGWREFAEDLGLFTAIAAGLWAATAASLQRFSPSSPKGAQAFVDSQEDPMGMLRRRFSKLVRRAKRRLAVFIDDLDRCDPEYVVRMLEGIQTLFRDEPITYVVAGDRRWIEASFDQHYSTLVESVSDPGKRLGQLFLQKAFQVSVQLPPITNAAIYWDSLLQGDRIGHVRPVSEGVDRERIRSQLADKSTPSEIDARLSKALREEPGLYHLWVIESLERESREDVKRMTESALREFHALLDRNPRTMKRFLNAYAIQRAAVKYVRALDELEIEEPWKQLALWTVVQMRWPRLGLFLTGDPAAVNIALEAIQPGDDVDKDMVQLLLDPKVQQVIKGDEVAVSLSEQAIRAFVGLPAGSLRTAVV